MKRGNFRFVIAPDDTPVRLYVCHLHRIGKYREERNSHRYGTDPPPVAAFFPNTRSFTTSYLTTQQVTNKQLPPNVGVIVSAIDYPLRRTDGKDEQDKKFAEQLDNWKKVTNNIYIWDYINNFDDYLTPFPILKIAQQRLQLFKQHGASGIFFNGSGYSYSSFDEMRTFVLSALLINPELPVDELIKSYFNQEYPVSEKMAVRLLHRARKQRPIWKAARTLRRYQRIGKRIPLSGEVYQIL